MFAQKQGAQQLKCRDSLLRVAIFESPWMIGRFDLVVAPENFRLEGWGSSLHQPPTWASPWAEALASLHPHQGDFGGEHCSKGRGEELLQEKGQHADNLGWMSHRLYGRLPRPEGLQQGLG